MNGYDFGDTTEKSFVTWSSPSLLVGTLLLGLPRAIAGTIFPILCAGFFRMSHTYSRTGDQTVLCLDEVPVLGEFIEIEGELEQIRSFRSTRANCIGAAVLRFETR